MSEAISVIITLVVVVGLQRLKPEWFIGWLLSFLNIKLDSRKANKIENSLAHFMTRIAIKIFKNNPDTEVINQAVSNIEKESKVIEEELKKNNIIINLVNSINKFLKKYDITIEVRENGIYFYKPQEIIRVDTKKKMEEVNQKIFEVLQTEEEKEKIESQINMLVESFNQQTNLNKTNEKINKFFRR